MSDDATKERVCFRRYLTKRPLHIPYAAITELKIGKSHAGRWLPGRQVLKVLWQREGRDLRSGFLVAKTAAETEEILRYMKARASL